MYLYIHICIYIYIYIFVYLDRNRESANSVQSDLLQPCIVACCAVQHVRIFSNRIRTGCHRLYLKCVPVSMDGRRTVNSDSTYRALNYTLHPVWNHSWAESCQHNCKTKPGIRIHAALNYFIYNYALNTETQRIYMAQYKNSIYIYIYWLFKINIFKLRIAFF